MATSPPDHITRPDFGVSVRGYDRAQVDAYFGRVVEWLADAENRARAAERSRESLAREVTNLRATVAMLEERAGLPAPQSMSTFSERMGQVMESALQAAQELRAEAEHEAGARREAASAEAERLLAGAREQADRILDAARRTSEEMEARVEGLRLARAEALKTMVDLQERIAAVVGGAEGAGGGEEPSDAGEGRAGGDDATVVSVRRARTSGTRGATTSDGSDDIERDPGGRDPAGDAAIPTEPATPGEPAGSAQSVGDVEQDPATTRVLVTPAPTVVQPVVDPAPGSRGTSVAGRRRSA